MKFEETLIFLRKQRGMTQNELAEKLDISRQAVSRWERGTAAPSTENLVRIGKLFGVPVDDLVNGTVPHQVEPPVPVNEAEGKEASKKRHTYCVAMFVGTMLIAIAVVFAICVGSRKGEPNVVPMEDTNKEMVDVSEAVTFPLMEFTNSED